MPALDGLYFVFVYRREGIFVHCDTPGYVFYRSTAGVFIFFWIVLRLGDGWVELKPLLVRILNSKPLFIRISNPIRYHIPDVVKCVGSKKAKQEVHTASGSKQKNASIYIHSIILLFSGR